MLRKIFTTCLLALSLAVAAPASANDSDHDYTWMSWRIPTGTVQGTPHGADDVGWPQQFEGYGKLTPNCGAWFQVDKYRGTGESLTWLFDDGLLTRTNGVPEDHAVVVDWYFVYGGDCTPPPPPPPVCPEGQVAGAPNDDGVYACQNDNPPPTPEPNPKPKPAPKPKPVHHTVHFTG